MGDTRDDAPAPVRVERLDTIAHVVLDRPGAANALSFELLAVLVDAIGRLVADGVRATVLSGAGGRFSAGADLDELSGEAGDIEFDDAVAAVGQALAEASFPVVAAIENYAFGAGVDLASVGLDWIQYVRVRNDDGPLDYSTEIDGFADVNPIPEPGSSLLLFAGLAGVAALTRARRSRLPLHTPIPGGCETPES